MKKNCTECGELLYGRTDKRFCGDACRSAFHNRRYGPALPCMRRVNRVLARNRRILATLRQAGRQAESRGRLREQGFRFDYFTHQNVTTEGTVRYCYDQGYRLTRGKIQLVE